MQCCNKHVIIYSGARVSELIRAIRSFISIDLMEQKATDNQSINQSIIKARFSVLQYFDHMLTILQSLDLNFKRQQI